MQVTPLLNTDPTTPSMRDRLEQLASQQAEKHSASVRKGPKALLFEYLEGCKQSLYQANLAFRKTSSKDLAFSRASVWMLDNYYVIEQAFHQIEQDLPPTYFDQLPKLEGTILKGYPRIYAVAWDLTQTSQAQLDLSQIAIFMNAYQRQRPLTLGELWALPIMLRIGILECLATAVSEITGTGRPLDPNSVSALSATPGLANETIVANCFVALRLLSASDWKPFIEQISRVEMILCNDPVKIYPVMDFETRNSYRTIIEELAQHSNESEESIAQSAIDLASKVQDQSPNSHTPSDRKAHVGYYLIDAGRPRLEKSIKYRSGPGAQLRRWLLSHPAALYLGSIQIISLVIVLGLLSYAWLVGGKLPQLVLVGLLVYGLALELAIGFVNRQVTRRIRPRSLPRMDFSGGIPSACRTMVVIPTLLSNIHELDSLLHDLELHFLSNQDRELAFALLTDFTDAPAQHMPEDEKLLWAAKAAVKGLNDKYRGAKPFYLFHRERDWNPSEGVWMGWERKRGKLAEFNQLLLNTGQTTYITQVGDLSFLAAIKYVITLDADTSLPQNSAARLIATLAHPLNRAVFDNDGHSVSSGYTVLQPRVDIKPTSANRSLFSQVFAGNSGFDLYTLAVSDVYQDLFGEGSYVGKGIYDVQAFEKSLAGQVRENTLLSHDLFEGIYGRAALVTDVILYEEYPSHYLVYTRRLNRWIRGDWQLLPWLFRTVRTEKGHARNRLSIIDRWKVFDNLRRSLLTPTYLLLLAAGWLVLPGSALFWTILVLLIPAMPVLSQSLRELKQNAGRLSLKGLIRPSRFPAIRWALAILFLPYESAFVLDAIGTTLARLTFDRKNLLQWTPAAHSARSLKLDDRAQVWWEMAPAVIYSIFIGVMVLWLRPPALITAAPLLIAWILSPVVAYQISQPIVHTRAPIGESQRKQLQRLARRTWAFFEQFAGPDDHWLPADHFQESPRGNITRYTTPTNIGLLLLSSLAAYDLGYMGLIELAVRIQSTFEVLEKLEHYRGHLLNWYDTQTLAPLPPRYVSTVDSGNLAAALIAIKQGCLGLAEAPVVRALRWEGLINILDILTEILMKLERKNPGPSIDSIGVELNRVSARILSIQNDPSQWTKGLLWLSGEGWDGVSQGILELLNNSSSKLDSESLSELRLYLDTFHHHLLSMQRNLDLLAPWLALLDEPPGIFLQAGGPEVLAWQTFRKSIPTHFPDLAQAESFYNNLRDTLAQLKSQLRDSRGPSEQMQLARNWCERLDKELSTAQITVGTLLAHYGDLAEQANLFVNDMDFKFLFDQQRQVFHIGYSVATEKLDASFYDLLASEARIASLIAIAKGDVPQSHWLHLGRPITRVGGRTVLLSWSGTMFEYLMPDLLIKNYEGTFLSDSCYAAVSAQMSFSNQKHIPWGISESGYYGFDPSMNYQYRAFGIPDLAIKRDVPEELVVAPYASLLALSLQPQAVLANMKRLEEMNMLGRFGFYEAVDFSKTHLPPGQHHAIVQSFMAHHQGMILVAACNFLSDSVMVRRFHADERIQSVELLLQEKIPQDLNIEYPHPVELEESKLIPRSVNITPWRVPSDSPLPQVHYLAQGDYGVMITNSGGGYSQWGEFALTRWHADATLDNWGTWIYVQDRENGEYWSVTCRPTGCSPEAQDVLYFPQKVEFRRWDHGISLHTEITVGLDNVEIRRVTLLNDTDRSRQLRLTSYAEIVLAQQATDQRHPAFNKLFIESEYLPEANALLFSRRLRSPNEKPVFMAHALLVEPGVRLTREYESDRARFLGRGQTQQTPDALKGNDNQPSGTAGGTLDPIMSLTQEIDLKPHTKTQVTYLTIAGSSRQEIQDHLTRYQSRQAINQAFDQALSHSEKELDELGLNVFGLQQVEQLLSALLYPTDALRAAPEILTRNEEGQSGLWAYGISGDYPILLVRLHNGDAPLLLEALQAYCYWRSRQVKVNLVILNQADTGYALDSHNLITRQILHMGADGWLNQRDGIFLLRSDQIPESYKILLETVAGVILDDNDGDLTAHANRLSKPPIRLPQFTPTLPRARDPEITAELTRPGDLLMDNGLGGFSADGKEYVIYLLRGQHTPHPWVNVVANPNFGFLVSEAGSGFSWSENSSENRLTPWRNDPVSDIPGEALYLRDEETGLVWSPTPMPAGEESAYLIRHGAGYSTFEHQSHGLNQCLRLFASTEDPVKIAHLRLENLWSRPRRITLTYFAEWVLGTSRDINQAHIIPEFEPASQALLARNNFNSDFGGRVAFLAANKKPHGLTADRTEFFGRTGSWATPEALTRIGLASTIRAGLDPCAALQLHVDLLPGQVEEIYFLIGEGASREESLALIKEYQEPSKVESAWESVGILWEDLLTGVSVRTPDAGMDLILNRWLLYQTISGRLWGRTGLYQSSGAFGFRDQLQDVMALLFTHPALTRQHILKAAQYQFDAGDVLHWWNPPSGRGVRTRFSDDLLWLPFVTAEYVLATGDADILREKISFLKGEPLKPTEVDRYNEYESTSETYSLFEHCRRALEKGSTAGSHGLPLIREGDWNDGMNLVGVEGRGESVWLAWFLHATLTRFGQLCTLMNLDPEPYRKQAENLLRATEANAWDGNWYLRAFYDDGSPLGSSQNTECRIDSIAQSWAVLSGVGNAARAAQAMESVNQLLINDSEQLLLLFTPPFDKTLHDPGYIKGYLPGIRENGGQYTHAAAWAVWAFALLGQGDRAAALFNMLNPISHSDSLEKTQKYKVEPYNLAADIYSAAPHTGQGGWTWYTGSAGWMYRLGIEAILGLSKSGNKLRISPCIPKDWPGYDLTYRFGNSRYLISVKNPYGLNQGIQRVLLDGSRLPENDIPLLDDGKEHEVQILMGQPVSAETKS
jgi:cyclic beta-1,2-glucan synthetase